MNSEREHFNTMIYAPKERVWGALWGKDTYPVWTSVFGEGSRAVSDWQEGSRIDFLNENNEGMIARIAEKRENEYLSFEHLGMIGENGKEDFDSEKVKAWAGAKENYALKEEDGKTELAVEMDIDDTYRDYFREKFPIALQKVKELAEGKNAF